MYLNNSLLLCGLVLCFSCCIVQAQQCGSCLSNNVQCINKTHFNLCFGTPAVAQKDIYACDGQTVCTGSANICEEDNNTNPAICDGTTGGSTGGSCDPTCTGAFHCVSTTQFSACSSNKVTGVKISCPANEFCSDKLLPTGKMCAPQNILDFFGFEVTCENAAPTVAVPTEPTLPPQEEYNAVCLNSSKKTGQSSYFFELNVDDCKTYIYCEVNTSTGYLLAMLMNCKTGQFYNATQERCVEATSCPQ